jgi:hypothetical protein
VASRRGAEGVALTPQRDECGAVWVPAAEEHWKAYLTGGEPPELALYCPKCPDHEFGGD